MIQLDVYFSKLCGDYAQSKLPFAVVFWINTLPSHPEPRFCDYTLGLPPPRMLAIWAGGESLGWDSRTNVACHPARWARFGSFQMGLFSAPKKWPKLNGYPWDCKPSSSSYNPSKPRSWWPCASLLALALLAFHRSGLGLKAGNVGDPVSKKTTFKWTLWWCTSIFFLGGGLVDTYTHPE